MAFPTNVGRFNYA